MTTGAPRTDDGIVSESRTAKGSLLNGVSSIVSTGLGFLLVILVTRNYGADDAGVLFGVIALFAIVATAAKLGTETALVFLIARYRSEGSHRSIREALVAALIPVLAISIAAAVALFILAPQLSNLFSGDRADDFARVLRALAPFLPAWAVGLVLLGATRGAGTMIPTAVGLQLVQPIAQVSLILVAADRGWDLSALALAWGAPLVATALIALAGLMPFLRVAETEPPVDRLKIWRDLWSFAGPRGLAGTLQVSLDRVGVLIIGALLTSTVAGQWVAITRLVGVAQRSFHAVGQALNPRVSSLAERQDWPAVARVFDQITIATVAALTPAVLALLFFPKAALDIFGGPEFEDVSRPLAIAALATFGAIAFAHVDNVLLMAGRSVTALIDTAAALVTTILLNLVLVPRFELSGAAIAMAAGIFVYRGSAAVQIARWFQVRPLSRPVVTVLVVALGVVGGGMFVGRIIAGDRLPVAVVTTILSVAVYVAVLATRGRSMGLNLRFDAD
jgi:O-antigen/teichoic acid export membrane protein